MSDRNPAKILYSADGYAHAVLVGETIYSTTPGLIVAGQDEDGIAQFLTLSSDGEMTTAKRSTQKQYDLESEPYWYIGTAERGLATSSVGWTIKRFEFISGEPQAQTSTDDKIATWTNRISESYS